VTKKALKERLISNLIELQSQNDTEAAHGNADDLLCQFLEKLGYPDVVKEYNKINKWYA
jgi:hypothetical protein